MKKEASRQSDKALFEGMTSLRAVLYAMENSVSDRKISKVWFDLSRAEKKSRELAFVKTKSKEYGFDLIPESGDFIESRALGTSHGGILFECTDRTVPHISEAKIPENGFIVMLEGIEDPIQFRVCREVALRGRCGCHRAFTAQLDERSRRCLPLVGGLLRDDPAFHG